MQDGFGGGDDDDDVGAHKRGMDPKRDRADGAQFDEVFALDVVHLDVTVEVTRELRRDECLELVVPCAAAEATRHQ